MSKQAGNRTGRQAKRRRARHLRRSNPWRLALDSAFFAVDHPLSQGTFSNVTAPAVTREHLQNAVAYLDRIRTDHAVALAPWRYCTEVRPVHPRFTIKLDV